MRRLRSTLWLACALGCGSGERADLPDAAVEVDAASSAGDAAARSDAGRDATVLPGDADAGAPARSADEECRPYYGGPLELDGYRDDFTRDPDAPDGRRDIALVFMPPAPGVYVAGLLSDAADLAVWVLRGRCGGEPLSGALDHLVMQPGAQWLAEPGEVYTLVVEISEGASWMQLVLGQYCADSDADCVSWAEDGMACGRAVLDAGPADCQPPPP